MMMLFLNILIFTSTYIALLQSYQLPEFGNVAICSSPVQFDDIMKTLVMVDNLLIIGIVSDNIAHDSYLTLYLGMILELFDFPELPSITVIYEKPANLHINDIALHMLSKLPRKSIFVSYEHGKSGFPLRNLEIARKYSRMETAVIYHLNHERPWMTISNEGETTNTLDHIYESVDQLIESYSLHPLVLRNYYFEPLLKYSFYLPVGPTLFGHMIGNSTSPIHKAKEKKASERTIYCKFKGRTRYDYMIFKEGKQFWNSADDNEDHVRERRQLIMLSDADKLGGCVAEEANPPDLRTHDSSSERYDKYIQLLADTAFAPCPAGNNPETFRHYEALEVGAIPIIVRPKDDDKNFLNCKFSTLNITARMI